MIKNNATFYDYEGNPENIRLWENKERTRAFMVRVVSKEEYDTHKLEHGLYLPHKNKRNCGGSLRTTPTEVGCV